MNINRELSYCESYLPSPRHRKYRWRVKTEVFTTGIREVASSKAPVAIQMGDSYLSHFAEQHGDIVGQRSVVKYRWFEESLYCLCRLARFRCLAGHRNRIASVNDIYRAEIARLVARILCAAAHCCDDLLWVEVGKVLTPVLRGQMGLCRRCGNRARQPHGALCPDCAELETTTQ
jgi:ribosomal protein L37E